LLLVGRVAVRQRGAVGARGGAGTGSLARRSTPIARLSPALEAVHASAAKLWTVDDLARLCNMSRATFARVFQQALGQAPMQYLADWRMTLARDLLLDG
jgi:transcriptional regulator GlxA family with amidase domain